MPMFANYTRWREASRTWCGYAVFESVAAMRAAQDTCTLKTEEFKRVVPYHHADRG